MKKHYNFTKASQGIMFRPAASLRIPVYLDQDVERALASGKQRTSKHLSQIVNSVLRKELEMAQMLNNG